MDDKRISMSVFDEEDDNLESKIEKLSVEEEALDGYGSAFNLQDSFSQLVQQYANPVAAKNAYLANFREMFDQKMQQIPFHFFELIILELSKLQGLDASSREFMLTRKRLEWLIVLPSVCSEENYHLGPAVEILYQHSYLQEDVKEQILDFVLEVNLRENSRAGYTICVCGPFPVPEVIASALNRKLFRFSAEDLSNPGEIKGNPWYTDGSMPGKMVQCLKSGGTANPLVLIDDIDKLGKSGCFGDPVSAMLELLDCKQNMNFLDDYLGVPVNLSRVLFVCTATAVEMIPSPLLDIMKVISLAKQQRAYPPPWCEERLICPGADWDLERCFYSNAMAE